MAKYWATVSWCRNEQAFVDNRYKRLHAWSFDGGAEVAASSSPHVVPEPYSDASAVDPEEAFVASISSCHMLWFLALAAEKSLVVDRYEDKAFGRMGKNDAGKIAVTRVVLSPAVTFAGRSPTEDEYAAMHHAAHEKCFIANSVRSEITCQPTLIDVGS